MSKRAVVAVIALACSLALARADLFRALKKVRIPCKCVTVHARVQAVRKATPQAWAPLER